MIDPVWVRQRMACIRVEQELATQRLAIAQSRLEKLDHYNAILSKLKEKVNKGEPLSDKELEWLDQLNKCLAKDRK